MDDGRWAWVDSASGAAVGVLGAIAGLFGWFNRKLDVLHGRINSMQKTVAAQASSIAVLEAQRKAESDRLERIEGALDAVNRKQDQQMGILLDLARRK